MKVGDVVKATIVNIKDFGALVDVDGCAGMIYYKNIRPRAEFGNISAVLSIGQKIDCVIEDIKDNGFLNLMHHPVKLRLSGTVLSLQCKEQGFDLLTLHIGIVRVHKSVLPVLLHRLRCRQTLHVGFTGLRERSVRVNELAYDSALCLQGEILVSLLDVP